MPNKPTTKTCAHCGATFLASKPRTLFCSRECVGMARLRKYVTATCGQCGIVFPTEPNVIAKGGGKYCSRACSVAGSRKSVPASCQLCGRSFEAKLSNIKRGGDKFCSQKCRLSRFGPFEERFWVKVDKRGPDDCWPWLAAKDQDGYGTFQTSGNRHSPSHRVAFELANGSIDPDLMVLHSCEDRYPPGDISSRACNNPAHLSQGTAADNTQQMIERGRKPVVIGEKNSFAKLTEDAVRAIRIRHAEGGVSFSELGELFGVKPVTVHDVIRGRSWKHVT